MALAETLGPRSPLLRVLLNRFADAAAIFAADETALQECIPDTQEELRKSILEKRAQKAALGIVAWCHRNGVHILTYDSPDYPACLREIDEPPAVLYCRGKLPALEKRLAVGVVGTRTSDAYGERVAYRLSFEMAAAGTIIVSGLAEGIDVIASIGALNAGGETIVVLGCGIDLVYPKKNTRVAAEVAERGTILTEYAPGTPPNGWNFPMRNRIISALSSAVLVVEAGERSGSLITARYGVVQGKTLFAVPGDITSPRSAGTNQLLADGALPALSSDDLLTYFRFLYRNEIKLEALPEAMQYSELTPEALRPYGLRMTPEASAAPAAERLTHREKSERRRKAKKEEPPAPLQKESADLSSLTPRQKEIYTLIPDGAFSVDALAAQGLPVSEAVSTLTVFEIYGLIRSIPGGMFEKI